MSKDRKMSEFIPTSTAHYNGNTHSNENMSKGLIARDSFSGSPDDQFLFNQSRAYTDHSKKENSLLQQGVAYDSNNRPTPI